MSGLKKKTDLTGCIGEMIHKTLSDQETSYIHEYFMKVMMLAVYPFWIRHNKKVVYRTAYDVIVIVKSFVWHVVV